MSKNSCTDSVGGLLKTREVCSTFGITPSTLNRWRAEGRISFHRIGRTVLFHPRDVDALMQSSRVVTHLAAEQA